MFLSLLEDDEDGALLAEDELNTALLLGIFVIFVRGQRDRSLLDLLNSKARTVDV